MDSMIATLRARLAQHKGRWPALAKRSEVPISSLRKIAQGHVKNPGVDTVDKLFRALEEPQ
jgi:predicted transcriptional regulator